MNELQFKHRYAMILHTDDNDPHVHVVIIAVSEQGRATQYQEGDVARLARQFAANLRELGVAANATERAVRGETKNA